MPDPTRQGWIERAARGRTFAEVGGLWGTVNEQVTVASQAGATGVAMIDIAPPLTQLWERFHERCSAAGIQNYQCHLADINDPATPDTVGSFEVVHCSGVLNHCPHPLMTVQHLGRITDRTLILGSATIPERVANRAGVMQMEPGSALLVPAAKPCQLDVLSEYLAEVNAFEAHGVNHPLKGGWHPNNYAGWWWFFTPDYVAGLLEVAGFKVQEIAPYWYGHATLYWADKA